ncbi:taurine catabolism dioxygenase TauD [Lentithecium fluviatile CBS 122367]|uniref:Taurine catabolism dioxygenase TauD n=1 Tax=Lentithecium fluviatile CBS 122367 TaxID=1168545 RepID=A0A6G1JGC8_9PLEO|nr:taurine catabolism dioxygenase TauD [Lentithecium fluviatile CBS 122367]
MSTASLSARSSMESLQSSLSVPDKLPPTMEGPMVWSGSKLKPADYIIRLTASDIREIRSAIISFKLLGLPRGAIDKTTFLLSSELSAKLSAKSTELHKGFGVAVIRGLDAANFNDEEATIAFVGICAHVCRLRATDSYANQTLSHVRDATHDDVPEWAKDIGLAGSKITSAMDFHSDRFSGDILALHVRDDGGADGGEQYLASFWKIYNELLEKDPAVLETMAEPNWPFELKQKDREPYLELGPTLFFSKGKPIVQLVKAPLLGSSRIPRDASMPPLSAEQLHALHAVEELAKKHCVLLDRQKGDIQFVNNLSIMHARSAYGTSSKRSTRHLLRMFLRDPENEWAKTGAFAANFNDPFTPGRKQELPVVDSDPWRKISGRESHG